MVLLREAQMTLLLLRERPVVGLLGRVSRGWDCFAEGRSVRRVHGGRVGGHGSFQCEIKSRQGSVTRSRDEFRYL